MIERPKRIRRRGRIGRGPAKITLAPVLHDRKTEDIPMNAQIAAIEVDDPYAQPGQTEKIVVIRSIRADPLGNMHARRHIDDAQFHAGRYWQYLYERSSVGVVKAMDTSKTPVDGGSANHDPISDEQIKAARKLRVAEIALGKRNAKLIRDVLGQGMFIAEAAQLRGADNHRAVLDWSHAFRQSLDILAVEFGLATKRAA